MHRRLPQPAVLRRSLLACLPALACGGCNSILNSWLDPSIPGNFRENTTTSIRSVLTIEDAPSAIPGATDPTRADLLPQPFEYHLGPGDVVAVEIEELRQVGVPFQSQFQLTPAGELAIPSVGRFTAAGLTPPQLEEEIKRRLREAQVLMDPRVLVFPVNIHSAQYMIFGIGVSAATNAPLRAVPVPITRPDMNVLEAINLVGGLNEFVTEVYVFRREHADQEPAAPAAPPPSPAPQDQVEPQAPPPLGSPPTQPRAKQAPAREERSAEDELMEAVTLEPPDDEDDQPAAPPEEPQAEAPPPAKADTLWIYQEGRFVPNPARVEQEPAAAQPPPVERLPYFEAMQSTVDWSRLSGDSHYRIIRVPAEALRTGDPDYMVMIRPGDVIRIVSGEIGVYYVMGQVNRTGPFTFNAEQVTLKSAIAAAGGLGPLAWPSRCTIYRRLGTREHMIQEDLDAIFAGKKDDIEIRRGDIINVGTSPLAPWLLRLRALTLPNPTATVGYSFTYARNFADIDSFAVQPNPVTRPKKFENLFP